MILDNDFIENEKKKFTDIIAKPKDDLVGMKFGRLTVICRANDYHYPNRDCTMAKWHCICDCENHTLIDVQHSHLKYGNTRSCGCLAKENSQQVIQLAIEATRKPLKNNPTLELNLVDGEHEPFGKFRCYNNDSEDVYFSMRDYDTLKDYGWCIHKDNCGRYLRVISGTNKVMHQILGMKDADHINRNALDNRRENLDNKATRSEQSHNQKVRYNNKSGVKGVWYERDGLSRPWRAQLKNCGEIVLNEFYVTKDEAIIARLNAEIRHLDERAWQKELMIQYGLIPKEAS